MAVAQDDFGRTGHRSSRTIFGAASLSRVTQAAADRTLEVLLRYGVNHIDTAASYGESERRIAPWLAREPGRFFIATKTGERKVAVQTIKSIAAKPWLGREPTRTTWYQPLEAQSDIDVAVWWVLGRPGMFLNTAGDIDLLPRVLDAAERFANRPTDAEMKTLLERSQTEPLFV